MGHERMRRHARRCNRASSDAGPELAGRESHCGDGKPVGPDRPLEKGVWGIDIGASEEEKEFSSSLGFHYICKKN